jgi:[acyl-carrier-protein] S-malonyltransferase
MAAELNATEFQDLRVPLINNVEAREVRTGADARRGLIEQIPNPVRWTETVRYLSAQGVSRTIETGAGHVLTGLVRSIDPAIHATRFSEAGDWEKVHGTVE